MPCSLPSLSSTHVIPRRLRDISWMTSGMAVSGRTTGRASPACMSASTRMRRLPIRPAGCRLANSSALKPLLLDKAIARASPSASVAVVLAVGARFIRHASSTTSQLSASVGRKPDRGLRLAGERDESGANPANRLDQTNQLLGLAAVGQGDHHVIASARRQGRRAPLRPRAETRRRCQCSTRSRRAYER